jgi:hypothetical protein
MGLMDSVDTPILGDRATTTSTSLRDWARTGLAGAPA